MAKILTNWHLIIGFVNIRWLAILPNKLYNGFKNKVNSLINWSKLIYKGNNTNKAEKSKLNVKEVIRIIKTMTERILVIFGINRNRARI